MQSVFKVIHTHVLCPEGRNLKWTERSRKREKRNMIGREKETRRRKCKKQEGRREKKRGPRRANRGHGHFVLATFQSQDFIQKDSVCANCAQPIHSLLHAQKGTLKPMQRVQWSPSERMRLQQVFTESPFVSNCLCVLFVCVCVCV